jgi:flavin reductase (DIM6/NTAB) family NADH-FMN oxidoreductase RutF
MDDLAHPSPADWRAAMGAFPTGVTIVTTWREGEPLGSTVNAFCSVSLVPPLLLVCLDRGNPLVEPVRACGVFGVNFLPHDGGQALAIRFARETEEQRFVGVGYGACEGGAPRLDVAPVFIDCAFEAAHEAGDHLIYVGRGRRVDHAHSIPPLLYHRGAFPGVHLG